MWDSAEFDDDEDDWEPLRHRRAGPIRVLAILVVIAMVLALVIPVLLRLLQDEPDEPRPDGVSVAVVVEDWSAPSRSSRSATLFGMDLRSRVPVRGCTCGRC